jgi:hypothetical protein
MYNVEVSVRYRLWAMKYTAVNAVKGLRASLLRQSAYFAFAIAIATFAASAAPAQSTDDDVRIYAVNVVKTAPFEKQFTGYGIYLGQGIVITAAHVVGHWPILTHPRVIIGGQDLPAKVIKNGSFETTDLALLSVEEATLPMSLRLRRNPLCNGSPKIGSEVINVIPEETTRARVISPLSIPVQLRKRFDTLIDSEKSSGSGLFDAERKCLLGIMSGKVQKYHYQLENVRIRGYMDGFAGYFVSAAKIAKFIPSDLHL